MKLIYSSLLLLLPVFIYAVDSTVPVTLHTQQLKGYKKLLYRAVLLHPKMNSTLERDLLKHYLLGSGSTYRLSDSDFIQLNKISPMYVVDQHCRAVVSTNQQYCIRRIDVNEDAYFGWALGNISGIYQMASGELISIADVYDFNKKKKGKRKRAYEFYTRIFIMLTPSSAKSFVVTYHADGYVVVL